MKIELDMYQTLALAVLVLMLGKFLRARVQVLERFCIPAPVIGSVLFAIFTCVCYVTGIAEFAFDDILKEVCMVMFFTSVGFQANLKVLKSGGRAMIVFLGVVIVLFPVFFLFGSRKIIRYIVQLSEEIQAMEGGDLDHPITIRGSDEITTLASCLDSMRVTLRQQQEEEAQASAKVKNLITEMSHDLRTPLTTLLLYTEILRCRKYETPEQADNYLNKIDAKARQIKQLSDNLFEYALVTRDTVAVLEPPAHFSAVFEEPLTEMVETLQQRGFACALELGDEDVLLSVSGQYVRRILDNITSNLLKYADPDRDVVVRFVQEGSKAGLCFENCVLPVPASSESTKVGLPSIETMMEKMQGVCRIERPEGVFRMTLLFKTAKE